MICTTIQNRNLEEIQKLLENPEIQMAEIRLDRCPLDEEDIDELFSNSDTPLVATCRVAGDGSGTWSEAQNKLLAAIQAGAAFADLEIEAPTPVGKKIRRACSEYGTVMIRSCHRFDGTPSLEELSGMAEKCASFGGEIVKIVALAKSEEEVRRILSLYDTDFKGRLIAFAMGPEGKESRIECLSKGAPFTYAALTEEEAAAPGQRDFRKMTKAVYGDRIFIEGKRPLAMPSSKSFAQRAILAAALSEGESRLGGYSPCGDNESALRVAGTLGAEVKVDGSVVTINGIGGFFRESKRPESVDVGESGLMTRLTIPVLAALSSVQVEVDGAGTLLRRPLKGAAEIMASFGTVLRPLQKAGTELHVPLTVQGPLLSGDKEISGKDGSQLISGLLMALALLPGDSTLVVHEPKSIPYLFITTDVLRHFGIRIGSEMEGDEDFEETQDWASCTDITFRIKGGQKYSAASFGLEGDWSAAANFLVAGAIFGKVQLEGLDTTSLQADISIMDILMDAGASLSQLEEEGHRGMITSQMAPLRSFDTDLNNCPDLFPIVAVLAAFCQGTCHIQGFRRLAGKESDRGTAILNMLSQMGVSASADGDVLTIEGESLASRSLGGRLLKGGEYTSSHDHRMAMALAVASLGADSPVVIDDTSCVSKSFPAFFETFSQLSSTR